MAPQHMSKYRSNIAFLLVSFLIITTVFLLAILLASNLVYAS